ncbi:unnamed protein product [Prorocentrum cordatum]|uniref:Uncharacterized protein n=1 Tax=Prorocentrum cordatum TaxID=2364126 RepID=A0ABN9SAK8_9DINO|nr:unnamed protein product [Polarella glacialis]
MLPPAARAVQLAGAGAPAVPAASSEGEAGSWLLEVRTHGDVTCAAEGDCVVGSGLGHCKVVVDPSQRIPLGSTDSGNASFHEFNSTVQYHESEITITGHSTSSHWNLCRSKEDASRVDLHQRKRSLADVCYEVDGLPGLCFLWASPCSGGCSTLRPFNEYSSVCPNWLRYATPSEWSVALPDMNANRKTYYSKCAADLMDPWWHHCDYANEFARVPDDGWNELVLVCDTTVPAMATTATSASSATGPAPTPMPLPPPPGPGLVPCGLTGGYSEWPEDATCASWIQGSAVGGGPNVFVGTVDTCHHCILAVLNAYPSAKGATFRTPGLTSQAGECYAEDGWLYPDSNPAWITIPVIASLQYYTDLASDPCSPAYGLTLKPTPAPTAVPLAPPTGGAGSAVGDPHLQNIYGERFDLLKPGKHVLINIPRDAVVVETALLRVDAEVRQMGGKCADMYFQELNITGAWVDSTKQTGGLYFKANDVVDSNTDWESFGKVSLKVVHGRTQRGIRYLNLYVKHLDRNGLSVGGLLGEDDHSEAAVSPRECSQTLSLIQGDF